MRLFLRRCVFVPNSINLCQSRISHSKKSTCTRASNSINANDFSFEKGNNSLKILRQSSRFHQWNIKFDKILKIIIIFYGSPEWFDDLFSVKIFSKPTVSKFRPISFIFDSIKALFISFMLIKSNLSSKVIVESQNYIEKEIWRVVSLVIILGEEHYQWILRILWPHFASFLFHFLGRVATIKFSYWVLFSFYLAEYFFFFSLFIFV